MIIKGFKIVWFVSLLTMVGVFIYCYASWPQIVNFSEEEGALAIDKGILFYSCLGLAGIFNALVFIITRMKFSMPFATWYYGLVISFHVFFVSMFIFITIFNSLEKYDYSKVGPILYGSMIVLLLWIMAWPVYYLFAQFRSQPKV
jgi:hypothetical protein